MPEFMRIIMEFLVPVLLILLVITQILLPIFVPGLAFFWLFKKGGTQHIATTESEVTQKTETVVEDLPDSISRLASEMETDAEKLKRTKSKVDDSISKLKSTRDNSLNNLNNN
jgi:hypothetical protein